VTETINLVKLCVGTERVEDLLSWQAMRMAQSELSNPRHVTRMWPKREAELLNGGSLYWVFKGLILARQNLIRLDEVIGEDGIRRCALVLDPQIVRTESQPRRAFQGWRYLTVALSQNRRSSVTKQKHFYANLKRCPIPGFSGCARLKPNRTTRVRLENHTHRRPDDIPPFFVRAFFYHITSYGQRAHH